MVSVEKARQHPSVKSQQTPVERMIATKKKLIKHLETEIVDVRISAQAEIKGIEFRIRQAKTILSALEKGQLS